MRYESDRDIELRLKGSVVMYDKRPVLIADVLGNGIVRAVDILADEGKTVKVVDLDLSPSSAKLGYVIGEGGELYYASRRPARKFKQGLTRENLFTFEAMNKPNDKDMAALIRQGGRPHFNPGSTHVARTIMGQYPSLEKAFTDVRAGKRKAMPFSREWAVADKDHELCLLFRGDVVGYVGDNSVKLLPEYFYLKESLQLCLM